MKRTPQAKVNDMATINFNPDTVVDDGKFDPLPPGEYQVEIVDSDIRATKTGTGNYVYLDMRVVTGAHEGRHLFDRLNYENVNQQTAEIARRTLKRICRLCDIRGDLADTRALHFKRFHISAGVKVDGYGPKNVVRYLEPRENGSQAQPPRQESPRQDAPTTDKPWQRKPRF